MFKVSIPLSLDMAHKLFYKAKLSNVIQIKDEGAEDFFEFARNDIMLNQWISAEFTEPEKKLKNKLSFFGIIKDSVVHKVDGLIGLNYIKYLSITKESGTLDFKVTDKL